jgi:CheY-like chemotaxis protein
LNKKVLLVDDSKFQRMANERALARAGYSVIVASDGEEAVRITNEQAPDIILLDMLLPKLDGVGVLRALKANARTANIPVIVLSGLPEANAPKLEAEGASAYLAKSTVLDKNSQKLLDTVQRLLHSQAAPSSR